MGGLDRVCVGEGLVFTSRFDSGNLSAARLAQDGSYELRIRRDCEGSVHERRSSTWFYFRVVDERDTEHRVARFRLTNINRQGGLYKNGFRVTTRRGSNRDCKCWASLHGCGGWSRLKSAVSYRERDGSAELQWDYVFEQRGDEVEFAFSYPYSYEELQQTLEAAARLAQTRRIFLHREVLCYSRQGRRVDLVTITSDRGTGATDDGLDKFARDPDASDHVDDDLSWLFPDMRAGKADRPPRFDGKPQILMSCRVHPGETPASFMLDGVLELLLRRDDPRAKALREKYVWRIVPMLNPDGVAAGHYRHDLSGVNLNRVYWPWPDAAAYPAQAALIILARSLRPLVLFLDLHAHASKRGVFAYGNALDDPTEQIETKLYALLLSVNSRHFEFAACNFSKEHMLRVDKEDGASAEGAARVAVHRYTGLVRAYTIESNYHCAKTANLLAPASTPDATPERRSAALKIEPFTPNTWREVGRALAISQLDLVEANPWSRVVNSSWKSVSAMRAWLRAHCSMRASTASRHHRFATALAAQRPATAGPNNNYGRRFGAETRATTPCSSSLPRQHCPTVFPSKCLRRFATNTPLPVGPATHVPNRQHCPPVPRTLDRVRGGALRSSGRSKIPMKSNIRTCPSRHTAPPVFSVQVT